MTSSNETPIARKVKRVAHRLGAGDLAALGRLYDISAARLVRYADAVTRNRQDTEDALQATMIRVAESPRLLALADHPWAYLLKIMRNESLRIISRRRPAQPLTNAVPAGAADPPALEREESHRCIRAAIGRLPAEQAEVVILKTWEGMTFQEIAEVLGESANTAASRYRYALAKLSRALQSLAPAPHLPADEVPHGR